MATGVNDYHLLPIFLISLVVLLSAIEFGRWLGARATDQGADEVLTLQGAVLGLLRLMIAFTFAMALSRFEGRRDAVLNEANAILLFQDLDRPSTGFITTSQKPMTETAAAIAKY